MVLINLFVIKYIFFKYRIFMAIRMVEWGAEKCSAQALIEGNSKISPVILLITITALVFLAFSLSR